LSSAHQLDARVRELFRSTFGYPPTAVSVAPGRMNVIGEHTDYNDGWVLPAAIDRHVAVAVRPRRDLQVTIISDRFPKAVTLNGLPAHKRGEWSDYVVGVARAVQELARTVDGFDVAIAGDIPVGAGLSSSGALEVACALALLTSRGIELSGLQIARLCQRAENEFVGARTGIMDQYTALFARARNALLLDCRSLEADAVPLPDPRYSWVLADTRLKHELSGSAYNDRRRECEAAAQSLGLRSLRDANAESLQRIPDALLARRARHVVSENGRVLQAAAALGERDVQKLGALLYASHESLRDDFAVSCAELDVLVDLARESRRAIGARMMGGGFGGCVLILAEGSDTADLEQHLHQGYAARFNRTPEFYRVRSVDGALPQG
jgi:galactokinase